jgi:hypothetical protein
MKAIVSLVICALLSSSMAGLLRNSQDSIALEVSQSNTCKFEAYEQKDFGGKRTVYTNNVEDLANDALTGHITSIKVGLGCQVTFWEHSNFEGRTKTFTHTVAWVGDNFNDLVGSFKINMKCEVTIYEHKDYKGKSLTLKENTASLIPLGFNEIVSAVKVTPGCQATLYENTDYQGTSKTFSGDVNWVGNDFNDVTSSIKLANAPECTVEMYQHASYEGTKVVLTSNTADMRTVNFNEIISSMKISAGCQVIAYENVNYQGKSKIFTGEISWVGNDFNDMLSSFQISAI